MGASKWLCRAALVLRKYASLLKRTATGFSRSRDQFAAEHKPEPFVLPRTVSLDGIGKQFTVTYMPGVGAKSVRYRTRGSELVLSGQDKR